MDHNKMEVADKRWLITTVGVSGWMFLLVLALLGCSGQYPESHKMVVCVLCVRITVIAWKEAL